MSDQHEWFFIKEANYGQFKIGCICGVYKYIPCMDITKYDRKQHESSLTDINATKEEVNKRRAES